MIDIGDKVLINKCLLFLLVYLISFTSYSAVYTIGIVPQYSRDHMREMWVPFTNYLSQLTGHNFIFKTESTISKFMDNVYAGNYDIIYTNPVSYVLANRKRDYTAFAKELDMKLQAAIVVRTTSENINNIDDLVNLEIAHPDGKAALSQITANYLKHKKINTSTVYLGSHEIVFQSVANGLYIAGTGSLKVLESLSKDIRDKLKIIWISEPFQGHAFAALPTVPKSVINDLTDAMLSMNNSENKKVYLNMIDFKGFELVTDKDWDSIRKFMNDNSNKK
jgi:phosphonate transport system substrate-binding protein